MLLLVATVLAGSFTEAETKHLAAGKQALALSRKGLHAEAVEVLVAFEKEAGAALTASSKKFLDEGIVLSRRRAELASAAMKDPASARALVLHLLAVRMRWDLADAEVGDPAVQELLNMLRAKDPGLKKLLSRHKVQVVVKSATLSEGQRRAYAAALAANLKGLGLDATTNAAGERYEVTAVANEPVSAHLIDDDADECELRATAAWSAAGLPAIDLNAHGFGDETVPSACQDARIKEGAALAAKRTLVALLSR
ncbi:MAG: hypothetical protein IAE78_21140 [Myxococcus sp.]|nr:hypothetical protein [Myxococcus sp.]